MAQMIARLEEDVHGMQGALGEQREVLNSMARDFSRFTTWTVTRLSRMMDQDGVRYTSYADFQISYVRRTRIKPGIIMEYLVKIRKKARIMELKRRHLKIADFDILYAVSILEDMAYLCLHFTRNHKDSKTTMSYPRDFYTLYSI
ncbi:hypothetical protein Tco_0631771 [Tanacetum coccineum]